MSRLARVALVALLATSALACVTGDRLWRVSPFEGGSSGERVNLWPLAYHDGDGTSVLWPLFDVDDQGFALRPLVAKDGPGYSVLFPLAAWDTDAGTGWAVPFYWFESNAGLFPLANFGSLSYVGPVWWTERSSGLFPLAHLGSLSYVGPVWWTKGEGAQGGLFPLAMFGPTSYVGPAWWAQGGDSFGLFPLFGIDLFGSGIDHAGPVWWRPGQDDGFEGGLFPLLSWGGGGERFTLLPLYGHDLSADVRSRNALLGLWHHTSSAAKDESWLLPLYFHRDEPGKADTALLPFFWKRTRGGESDVYTLLGNRAVDPASASFNLYPLWWSSASPGASWKMLFPLFYLAREDDERTLLTPLGGRGWSTSGEDAFLNVLGPLYHHSASQRRDEERTAFLWPLFERHRRGEERTTRVAGLYTRTSSPGVSESSFVLGLGHARRTPSGSSQRLWPLYSWSDEVERPGPLYGLTLYGRHEQGESSSRHLFPLFSGASSPAGSEWNALLGLVHRDSEGGEALPRRRTWAWPLFSRSTGRAAGFADRTTLVGSARWKGGRYFQLGAGLLHSSSVSSSREERAEVRRAHGRTLLFFTHEEEHLVGDHVPTPEPARVQNRVRHESRGFLFDAFVSESDTYHVWREGALSPDEARVLRATSFADAREGLPDRTAARDVLAARGVAPRDDSAEAVRDAIAAFVAENTRTVERRHLRVPLLFGYERSQDELEWSGPLGLVHHARDPQSSRFDLFYYGYRSRTESGRTSRDIFPFVTWDTGPEETRVSFLWRFLHYERRGERRGGHLLFVPWGDL